MPLDDFLRREIEVGSFPGAVYAIGSSHGIERENALGHAVAVPLRIPATLDTIYDCASLTKPLITTTLALQLLTVEVYGTKGAVPASITDPSWTHLATAHLTKRRVRVDLPAAGRRVSALALWIPMAPASTSEVKIAEVAVFR